ncbi:L-ascorbate metabolism protein UlaG (beta-lactamase superfamily) [Solirubrobacter pauli]|uniref:L-ascorbate metabolism protein UlaG (Beta-lactamase superfamily) n=1 Tax=Solirubrobacter pauli TaxID=166793 RepID=A0A660LE23_9ACTN|nr:MBL fold metallo-hydrolase [Solirubrobacter pauli]RKQ92829.1 L-ascorbate metabolism protein UlaG (beta-lactamase superfamily) [Solirubrobacter pauli]
MKLTLIRHSTLRMDVAGHTLLVDPQLDPAGAREAVPNTPNPRRSPLVNLPEPAEAVVASIDAVLLTHTHQDHWDATARELIAHDTPIFCQPADAERLHADGYIDARPVHADAKLGELLIVRTDGHHGTGEVGEAMGSVSGFVLHAPGEPSVYVAGDTILCQEVLDAVEEHRPQLIVVNGSGARFNTSDPIVMDNDDIVELARAVPNAQIVVVHLDTVSHGTETRVDVRARLTAEGLTDRVLVPEDGAEI